MTDQETARILAILKSVWPAHPVLEETQTAWMWAFEKVPYSLAEDATKRWITGGAQFFPTPSQLLKTIAVERVAPDLIPEAAWIEVLDQVRKVGYGPRTLFRNGKREALPGPAFSHPLIAKAVESVGWKNICHSDEPTIVRAQFLKTLAALIDAEVGRLQAQAVPRLINLPHGGLGLDDGPAMIGAGK